MKKFILRPWSLDDIPSLLKYANNYQIAKNLTNQFPHPYTEQDGRNFINMASSANPLRIFAIEVNGEAAGGIGVHPQSDIHVKCAEMGYWLAEPYWGSGIMTAAVKEMVIYAFDNFDIIRLYARPFSSNTGSQRVLEKAGFELEARLKKSVFKYGEVLDELIYSIVK
jgi:RimJ/RimL family protein N-acetyltransferase